MTEVGHMDGVVKFERNGGSNCLCCPEGNHIWARTVMAEPFTLRSGRSGTTLSVFLQDQLARHPELEGKRVRVTLVALDE